MDPILIGFVKQHQPLLLVFQEPVGEDPTQIGIRGTWLLLSRKQAEYKLNAEQQEQKQKGT